MHFDLIDRVIEQTPTTIRAVKNVTSAEEYLGDHFPGFALLPGVMMLETLVQAGRHLLADRGGGPWVLAEVRNVRYANMVRPGQTLMVQVTIKAAKEAAKEEGDGAGKQEGEVDLIGVGEVDGQTAVQGRFILKPLAIGWPIR